VSEERVARELTIRGHVQGVFFRDSVRRLAERRELAGWAANEPDGSVRVLVEGPRAGVEAVIEFCRRGPRGAYVDRVDVSESEPQRRAGFQVR
jgi:acylphosphatase